MRLWELDFARGIVIMMMVAFHFLFDLNWLGFASIDLYSGTWGYWQKTIGGSFLFLVGILLTISYARSKKDFAHRFLKRGLIIFGAGMIVTAATWLLFPEDFIYFGVLHLIGVSIVLSIPLVDKKTLSAALGTALILLPVFFSPNSLGITGLSWLGLDAPSPTLDYYPVIPWFGAVLLGTAFGNAFYGNGKPLFKLKKPESKAIGLVETLGKHSLLIYFVHQPLIFSALYAFSLLA